MNTYPKVGGRYVLLLRHSILEPTYLELEAVAVHHSCHLLDVFYLEVVVLLIAL